MLEIVPEILTFEAKFLKKQLLTGSISVGTRQVL